METQDTIQNTPKILEGYEKLLDFDQYRMNQWLILALSGHETLPRLTPDESNHLAIVRLSKTFPLLQLILIKKAEMELVELFCEDPNLGEEIYKEELLWLAGEFQHPQSIKNLADLADNAKSFNGLDLKLRHTLLSRLVYSKPSQSTSFWLRRVNEDVQKYGAIALSGILENNDLKTAVSIISELPDTEKMATAIKVKLTLKWDKLDLCQKSLLILFLEKEMKQCQGIIASSIEKWITNKKESLLDS